MEKQKKKINWKNIVIILMAGVLVFCLVKIDELLDKNIYLEQKIGNLSSEISSIESTINSIYDNVDEQLKKEASLLAGMDYEIGDLNNDKKTVPVKFTIVPKELREDMTVSLSLEDETIALTKNGDTYVGTIDVDMFLGYNEYPLLSIETPESRKTEFLEDVWIYNLYQQFIPTVSADMFGRTTYHNESTKVTVNQTLSIGTLLNGMYSAEAGEAFCTSYEIVTELNGKEISREDITTEVLAAKEQYDVEYVKEYDLNSEDLLVIYVEAEDTLGYLHKTCVLYWQREEESVAAPEPVEYYVEYIYDKDGNLLLDGMY